ncbi:hypothetical protein ASPWEDRAFT_537676 [Aspergillus wentii DTO 134E9]|uniref:Uncharacterized protein n=1 Tax=Aspergillus wentii DTO 134E9 TaxID=1073089 RepID=A0A1L9RMM5_ASPWE|nr:uncharacterized protein ASPWEDRAFT_537676 [Aspergillus wentii DTO 134E9]KAI9929350.1 hypothetical protein MW887_000818 [Aspergillus wentii]OJJ36210.1 hypothetical protein ASPWEDRAFT_537676 [Aspergillus wentii DTO 134E9]
MTVGNSLKDHIFMRAWRLLWVAAIFGFVIASNMHNIIIIYSGRHELPTQCILKDVPHGLEISWQAHIYSTGPFVVSAIFWAWGLYMVTCILCPEGWDLLGRLFTPIVSFLNKALSFLSLPRLYMATVNRSTRNQGSITSWAWWVMSKIIFIPFLLYFTMVQLWCSQFKDLWRIGTSLVTLTCSIYGLKQSIEGDEYNHLPQDESDDDDNALGFGQIMSLLLLALPMF